VTTTTTPPAVAADAGNGTPQTFVWTRPLLRRLIDAGVIREGDRVELIDGNLVTMPVQKEPHAVAVGLTEDALRGVFGAGYLARGQQPVTLSDRSEPEPDVVVVPGTRRDYLRDHPTAVQILLLVEVADTTLWYDRSHKLSMYAKSGIADAWILNLPERVLEVYRDPAPDPAAEYGFGYRSRLIVPADGAVAPLALPAKPVPVADLLP
jgi:Uma2 family endonuclease